MTGAIMLLTLFYSFAIILGRRTSQIASSVNALILAIMLSAALTIASAYNTYAVADKYVYLAMFNEASRTDLFDLPLDGDLGFMTVLWLLSQLGEATEPLLFGSMAALLAVSYCRLAFSSLPPWAVPASIVMAISTGILFSYAVVAIRQGLSVALILLAVSSILLGNSKISTLTLLAISTLFHWSAIVPAIAIAAISLKRVHLSRLTVAWTALALLYITSLQERVLSPLLVRLEVATDLISPQAYAAYGSTGNRWDFLLVSALFAAIGLVFVKRFPDDELLERLVATYLVLNGFFLTFGFIAYSDRVASYSWIFAPLIIWRGLALGRGVVAPILAYIASIVFGSLISVNLLTIL